MIVVVLTRQRPKPSGSIAIRALSIPARRRARASSLRAMVSLEIIRSSISSSVIRAVRFRGTGNEVCVTVVGSLST